MKIRLKLTLSLLFLFAVILLLGGVGIHYLQRLAKDSEAIIKNNYRTLVYMQNLDKALDQLQVLLPQMDNNPKILPEIEKAKKLFEENLGHQFENVTEPGEQQLSYNLNADYKKLLQMIDFFKNNSDTGYYLTQIIPHVFRLEEQIERIYLLNGETILQKNQRANQTAERVILYMAIVGGSAIMVSLLFVIGIPSYIFKPIYRLNEAILQISRGNYKLTLPVKSKNEFGQLAESFNKMAAKLEEYELSQYARILQEKKRIDAIANQMQEAIIGLDENKIVIFINERALKLLGLNRGQIMGKYAPDVAVNNRLMEGLISELMIAFEDWEEKKYKPIKIVENKRQKLFSKNIIDITGKPTGENREVLIGHVIILTDITEFAEREVAKTHFMATLSHELKTPTSAIEMSIDLLKKDEVGTLNTEQSELLNTISGNNERIQRTIREILDLSKIESGAIDILKEEVIPAQIIDKAIEGVALFLKDKNINIDLKVSEDLPAISVDPHKTVWVLNNFLTNAIRYSPDNGQIIIRAEEKGNHIAISVKDQGLGISKENQKRIFKKFSRIAEDQTKGTGLGLVISKEFIEAMGGTIGVTSKEGEGSLFWVMFPAQKTEKIGH